MSALVAKSESQEGAAVLDGHTALEFIVGVTAGLSKAEPHLAILGILVFEAAQEYFVYGKGGVLERQHGESYANRIADAIALIAGVAIGHHYRGLADERVAQHAQAEVTTNSTAGWR